MKGAVMTAGYKGFDGLRVLSRDASAEELQGYAESALALAKMASTHFIMRVKEVSLAPLRMRAGPAAHLLRAMLTVRYSTNGQEARVECHLRMQEVVPPPGQRSSGVEVSLVRLAVEHPQLEGEAVELPLDLTRPTYEATVAGGAVVIPIPIPDFPLEWWQRLVDAVTVPMLANVATLPEVLERKS